MKMQPADHEMLLRQLIREDIERKLLYEGLIFTHSLPMLNSYLREIGFNTKRDFEFNPMKNIILVKFNLNENNVERYEKLNKVMDNLGGWFHAASIAGTLLTNKLTFLKELHGTVFLQFEPKHDIEVPTPHTLYHLTKPSRLSKIHKIGLTPKSSELYFNYKDRIYFALDKSSLKKFAEQKKQIDLGKIHKKEKEYKSSIQRENDLEQVGKFAILTIQPQGTKLYTRFFKDPNFFDGYYTKENLHPFAVKDVEYFEI